MKYRTMLVKIMALTFLPFMMSAMVTSNCLGSEVSASILLNKKDSTMKMTFEALIDVINFAKKADKNNLLKNEPFKDISITGKVVEEGTGLPLPGVSIKVKGSSTTAITDANGNYTISVPNNQTVLIFSYVGFKPQEKLVGDVKTINITLESAEDNLSEVVVVGYGTQRKGDVTGSVVRANLDDFRNSPTSNVASLLQGTLPGLNVGQVNRAGATPGISIRGTNTLSGNANVLIVLDGVQYTGSLTSINPDDIASIDILKDASATAVYGAQAANGVMLITSRKGVAGRTRITFKSQYATQAPNIDVRPMGRDEYLEKIRYLYYEQAFLAPSFTEPNPAFDLISKVDPAMKDAQGNLLPHDFSWYDEASQTGYVWDNQLSLSGGSEKITYVLSGNLTKNVGFISNDIFKRKGIRANLEAKATDWLTVGLQSYGSFVNEDGEEPNIGNIRILSPLISPWDESGNLKINPFNTNITNPFLSYQADDYDRNNYFFANIYGNIKLPLKGLSYKLNFGNNYRQTLKFISNQYDANLTGQASKESTNYYDYTLDNILTYNRTFGKHNITATLLYGAIERQQDYTRAYSNGFSRITLGYNGLDQGVNRFAESNAYKESLNYQMARLNYGFDGGKYLLTATLRRDGFSGFAENYKSALFPSLSLGWDISKESFFKVDWVNLLKLRVGYGTVGNQTQRYQSLARVTTSAAYVFGDGGATQFGQQVASLPNPDLKWERTTGLNIGLEFTVLKNRISGTFDYYDNKTTNLLYEVNIPTVTGFDQIQSNVGQLDNKGIELSLTSKNISTTNFQWSSTVNLSRNVNKVTKLLGDVNGDGVEDDLPQSGLFIGQSSSVIFDYQVNGIWQVGEQIPAGYSPGTYRIVDQNGDGIIDANDRSILGIGAPSFRASVLNNFQYKNFTLSVFLNAIYGGANSYLAGNTPRMIRDDNRIRNNHLSGIDFWSPDNPDGKYPRSIVSATLQPSLYQNRSFLRLQNVELGYKFTGKWMEKMQLQGLSLFVSGRNLYTWTDWDGWDPETNQGFTTDGRPVLKGYAVGLNVTF